MAVATILLAVTFIQILEGERDRVSHRTAQLAADESESDVYIAERDDWWAGEQYSVIWIQAAADSDIATLPPGVEALPEPGHSVLSPGLAKLVAQNAQLAKRYPDYVVIEPEGVRNLEELFAYQGVAPGVLDHDRRALRVASFTPNASGGPVGFTLLLGGLAPLVPSTLTIGAMLVIPVVALAMLGSQARSASRERRFRLLSMLGSSRLRMANLAFLETILLALPWAILSGIASSAYLFWRPELPFLDYRIHPADVWLPLAYLPAVILAVVVVQGLAATFDVLRWTSSGGRGSTAGQPASHRDIYMLPVLILAASFLATATVDDSTWRSVNLAIFVALIASFWFVCPWVVRQTGALVAALPSALAVLAGRRLEWDPRASARPFVVAAILIAVGLAVEGQVAAATAGDPSEHAGEEHGRAEPWALLRWLAPAAGDVSHLAQALPGYAVFPAHSDGRVLRIYTTCDEIANATSGFDCDAANTTALPQEGQRELQERIGLPQTHFALGALGSEPVREALVLHVADAGARTADIHTAAIRTLVGPTVITDITFASGQDELGRWLRTGVIATLAMASMAVLLFLIDDTLASRGSAQRLSESVCPLDRLQSQP